MSHKKSEVVVNPPRVLNIRVAEAAKILGCTVSFLRGEIRKNRIAPIRLGKRFVFPWEEIQRYNSQTCEEQDCISGVK